eukprot:m.21035 g.21035  ORF g.21035 m.21035 type:complete len:331 (+) comp8237_c0_seq1:235-1227(+)
MSAKRESTAAKPASKKASTSPLEALLKGTTVRQITKQQRKHVVTIEHSARVTVALDTLAENNILSAPVVYASSMEDNDGDTFVGMIDMHTILNGLFEGVQGDDWQGLIDGSKDFFSRMLITVVGEDVELRFKGYSQTSLHELIVDGFLGEGTKEEAHAVRHRVAMFTATGRITNIISMSDVIRYFQAHQQVFGEQLQASITDLGLITSPVVTSLETDAAAAGLYKMVQEKVAAVAVVDKKGKFKGQLSETDLRGITADSLDQIKLPVAAFIKQRGHAHEADVTCLASASLVSVLNKMVTHNLHRLFVTDEARKVVGVVSHTEILRFAVSA